MIRKYLKKNLIYIILILLITSIFFLVFNSNINKYILNFDLNIANCIKKIVNNRFTIVFIMITNLVAVYIPILIGMCMFIKKRKELIILGLIMLSTGIFTLAIKTLIARPRPLAAIVSIPKNYSFPSGHTLISTVFYLTLAYMLVNNKNKNEKKLTYFYMFLLILSVGFSRIYLGVHFFTDVTFGLIYGLLIHKLSTGIIKMYNKN